MFVNIEFLGEEPIENVITCMHHKFDKVIFFGYENVISEQKKRTDYFLKKYCGVYEITYYVLPKNDLNVVLDEINQVLSREIKWGNRIYFDITGGESLILVAFGILAKEFGTSIHQYDIMNDKIMEFSVETNSCLTREVPVNYVEWNLHSCIELNGGIINGNNHKANKSLEDDEFAKDMDALWDISKKYGIQWNYFSGFSRQYLIPDENLWVKQDRDYIEQKLKLSNNKFTSVSLLNNIINDLRDAGIFLGEGRENGHYQYQIKNRMIKDCMWESGSILELHVYKNEKSNADDCMVGVYLDWDGVVMTSGEPDVINEIDVLSLHGNIATFISCKSGNMSGAQILHALYELETVARRFGGKYAKKILVTTNSIGKTYLERAKEMNIEIQMIG
ncbi:MAG: Card1-like endonuclease domain-containing protein [Lachnospiraceae bacterium]